LVFLENTVEAPRDNPLEIHVSNLNSLSATVTVSNPLEIHVSNLNSLSATVTVSSPRTSCGEETKVVPASKWRIHLPLALQN